jgi:hypothetical protein
MSSSVRYELRELERAFDSGPPPDAVKADIWRDQVKSEVDRIKQTLIQEVFSFEDERHLERYIQYHQQALIQLMDKSAMLLTSTGDMGKIFYQIFYNGFDEILSFIERHFTKYFDQDAKAPEGYISLSRKDARLNIRKLQKLMVAKNADQTLVDLVLHILNKIVDGSSAKGITYRKVLYSKEVQKELFKLLDKPVAGKELNEELRQLMYYLNYNSTKVLTYHAHYFNFLLDESEFRNEKIEKLSFELKKIIQAQVKPGISYNQNSPSLKSLLADYINVELEYQERLQQLSNHSTDPPSGNFLDGFKLKFEASVSQLAYILKLLRETKVIVNNNLSQLMAFIVRFVVTKKSDSVSIGSLRSKYYNIEIGTKESVRTMLMTMIQHIDRN